MFSLLRVFAPPKHAVLSLEVQAGMTQAEPEKHEQFDVLLRHFLERFFNSEMASSDDDAKARLIQIACAVGLPGFIMALYLYPPYHDIRAARPYWPQVNDHYFYVMYSLVAMGIVTVFEWDLFFPDLLDVLVLFSLPVREQVLFRARIAAIAIFIGGFLFDSNFLAPLVLPAAMDPPNLARFLMAHVVSVAMSGTFAAAFFLAMQGMLLGLLGERFFRRISLWLQGLSIAALFSVLLLWPVMSGALDGFMHSRSTVVLCFPPFWFLGIYQRLMEGPDVLPIFAKLAHIATAATLLAIALAIASYPLAYWRRTRQLIEGAGAGSTQRGLGSPIDRVLHAVTRVKPVRSAISNFISQTLPRVPRYRIYLVMYGGLGIALVAACALRVGVTGGYMRATLYPDGLRMAVPIVAFWTIAGLHMAFTSPTDEIGRWVFRVVLGKPGMEPSTAARLWVLTWGLILTLGTVAVVYAIAPAELRGWRVTGVQVLVAVGLCLLLSDVFFLKVKSIPFTGGRPIASTLNLAWVLIRYFGLFPPLVLVTLSVEGWLEESVLHIAIAVVVIAVAHARMMKIHRRLMEEFVALIDVDDDEDEFPQRLGLRY